MNNIKLYTVKEAAKLVGVSTNTLYKYLDEDRIHAARGSALQGRFRIPESALEEFLGVKLSSPEIAQESTVENNTITSSTSVSLETENTISSLTRTSTTSKLPIKIARFLLIIALIAILIDLFISRSVSLPAQLSRITFIVIMLLMAYQEGGYRRG